ncbi:MAG: nitronate monooxygenase [Rickettsiales bacterium]|jgi:NAD(P)H-dependent flavin oxidoreductase YrpB (nitropropane dioxygenase family)|nr:nitronate monooxygenase [Rickettsiales bacterium]
MINNIKKIWLAGREIFPIVEGGKGVAVSTGLTSGRFAAEDCAGTFSAVMPDGYDENGKAVPVITPGKTRMERHREMIRKSIENGLQNVEIAWRESKGKGRILMNMLWGLGGSREILEGILEKADGKVHGLCVGAGMPYQLGEIAAKFKVYYQPIVSSTRAFRALWSRGFEKSREWLGGVIYECPWRAGGHNGITSAEDPTIPQNQLPRLVELRQFMNSVGLAAVPIIIAGGIWSLSEAHAYIDNPEIQPVAFQLGTRPLLAAESPVSELWRDALLNLKEGDVKLQKFSPTGFYSSAVNNEFVQNLMARKGREVAFFDEPADGRVALDKSFHGLTGESRQFFVNASDLEKINEWRAQGFVVAMPTPDSSFVFETEAMAKNIIAQQNACSGCLAACKFSGWNSFEPDKEMPRDPRSFCIKNTLVAAAHSKADGKNLIFAGHLAYKFANDELFANNSRPTIHEFIEQVKQGL